MEELQGRLKSFILLENCIRRKFKEKLDSIEKADYNIMMELASARWRSDDSVALGLGKLKKVADGINQNFTEFRLIDMLKLFYFFIGFHEEVEYKMDKSHPLMNLIKKPNGYSFDSTASYVINRFEEATTGKDVWENNLRIEMCLAYLLIFNSRLLFSPYLKEGVGDLEVHGNTLNKPISGLINKNILLGGISLEKTRFISVAQGVLGDYDVQNLSREQWIELTTLSLANLVNLLNISSYLKNEIYDAEWQILRPSFFEMSKYNWTTKTFMCRFFEGPWFGDEKFPFESVKPEKYELWNA